MVQSELFRLRIGDYLVVGIACCALLIFFLLLSKGVGTAAAQVHIYSPKGEYIYPLSDSRLVEINDGDRYSLIEINQGMVRMKEDNSPRQLAVSQGWIDTPGEWIINLPHEIAITIESGDRGADLVDSVLY